MRHHKATADTLDPLATLPSIGSLPRQTRERIDSTSVEVRLSAGKSLITQGRPGRQTFIITEGQAEVRRDGRLTAVGSAGSLVGETAVMLGGARTADVVALTDVTLLVMSPAELVSLCDDPAFSAWANDRLAEHAVPA